MAHADELFCSAWNGRHRDLSRRVNAGEATLEAAPVSAAALAALIRRIADGTISNNAARQVFEAIWTGEGSDVDAVIEDVDCKAFAGDEVVEELANPPWHGASQLKGVSCEQALQGVPLLPEELQVTA